MNFDILNNKPIEFFNENGDLVGQIFISGSTGDLYLRASGSNGDIILGDQSTVGDVEIGLPSAASNLKLMGGGTLSANGNTLIIGDPTIGDQVQLHNVSFTQSLNITGSINVTGSIEAQQFIGSGFSLTDMTVAGTIRTLFTSCSIKYSNGLVSQVTQSYDGGGQQITNIAYSSGLPSSLEVTGSDSVNKKYTFTYDGSDITEIRVT